MKLTELEYISSIKLELIEWEFAISVDFDIWDDKDIFIGLAWLVYWHQELESLEAS